MVAVAALAACGDDAVDASAACARLDEVAVGFQAGRDLNDLEQMQAALREPLTVFVRAAEEAGDDELAELAAAADQAFGRYLASEDFPDAEEDALALARGSRRCEDLGFPMHAVVP